MYNDGGSPTVRRCLFSNNFSPTYGAGMYNGNGSYPSVEDCTFVDNRGWGMSNEDSDPIVTNCEFFNPSGNMWNLRSSPTVAHCSFRGDRGTSGYGGMRNEDHSSPSVSDCLFLENRAGSLLRSAGGMSNYDNCSPVVQRCKFIHNADGGMRNYKDSDAEVIDCEFIANSGSDGAGSLHHAAHIGGGGRRLFLLRLFGHNRLGRYQDARHGGCVL